MIDRYTKIVLTVIAGSLAIIAGQSLVKEAQAQFGEGCGRLRLNPCHVTISDSVKVYGDVTALPPGPNGMPVYVVNR